MGRSQVSGKDGRQFVLNFKFLVDIEIYVFIIKNVAERKKVV